MKPTPYYCYLDVFAQHHVCDLVVGSGAIRQVHMQHTVHLQQDIRWCGTAVMTLTFTTNVCVLLSPFLTGGRGEVRLGQRPTGTWLLAHCRLG